MKLARQLIVPILKPLQGFPLRVNISPLLERKHTIRGRGEKREHTAQIHAMQKRPRLEVTTEWVEPERMNSKPYKTLRDTGL